jgi:hypothetical protein
MSNLASQLGQLGLARNYSVSVLSLLDSPLTNQHCLLTDPHSTLIFLSFVFMTSQLNRHPIHYHFSLFSCRNTLNLGRLTHTFPGICQQLEPYFENVHPSRHAPLVVRTMKGCLRLHGSAIK